MNYNIQVYNKKTTYQNQPLVQCYAKTFLNLDKIREQKLGKLMKLVITSDSLRLFPAKEHQGARAQQESSVILTLARGR